jgi:hypothetical protein
MGNFVWHSNFAVIIKSTSRVLLYTPYVYCNVTNCWAKMRFNNQDLNIEIQECHSPGIMLVAVKFLQRNATHSIPTRVPRPNDTVWLSIETKPSTNMQDVLQGNQIRGRSRRTISLLFSDSGGDSASYYFAVKMLKWKTLRYREGFSELVLL